MSGYFWRSSRTLAALLRAAQMTRHPACSDSVLWDSSFSRTVTKVPEKETKMGLSPHNSQWLRGQRCHSSPGGAKWKILQVLPQVWLEQTVQDPSKWGKQKNPGKSVLSPTWSRQAEEIRMVRPRKNVWADVQSTKKIHSTHHVIPNLISGWIRQKLLISQQFHARTWEYFTSPQESVSLYRKQDGTGNWDRTRMRQILNLGQCCG